MTYKQGDSVVLDRVTLATVISEPDDNGTLPVMINGSRLIKRATLDQLEPFENLRRRT